MVLCGLETISWDSDDLSKLHAETKVIPSLPTCRNTNGHPRLYPCLYHWQSHNSGFFGDASRQGWGHLVQAEAHDSGFTRTPVNKKELPEGSPSVLVERSKEGGTLQISTLLAASSISSLRASALAPAGCKLLDKPEDLEVCCHLMENRRKRGEV